jgi:hypothetical protein
MTRKEYDTWKAEASIDAVEHTTIINHMSRLQFESLRGKRMTGDLHISYIQRILQEPTFALDPCTKW